MGPAGHPSARVNFTERGGFLRVDISPPRGGHRSITALLMIAAAAAFSRSAVRLSFPEPVAVAIIALLAILGAVTLAAALRKETVEATASGLALGYRLGPIARMHEYPAAEVRSLRAWPGERATSGPGVAFESARGTVRFGNGLSDADAHKTVDRLLAILPEAATPRAVLGL